MMRECWVWPLRPFASDLPENRFVETDRPPGQVIQVVIGKTPNASNFLTGEVYSWHTHYDYYYIPTPEDIDTVQEEWPELDPENPSWINVKAMLVRQGGWPAKELVEEEPPMLMDRLREIRDGQTGIDPSIVTDDIPLRIQKVAAQHDDAWKIAKERFPQPTARQVYLVAKRQHDESDEPGEMLAFDTWTRYLREYRKLTDQQATSRRAGRADDARNIVTPDEI